MRLVSIWIFTPNRGSLFPAAVSHSNGSGIDNTS
jgi:hypothetical protein